jgi:hypothetical protein
MRTVHTVLTVLLLCAAAHAQPFGSDGEFLIHVVDRDVDAAFELVTQDTGFTPMSTDTTVMAAFDTTGIALASSADTAKITMVGIRHSGTSKTRERIQRKIKLAGGDTIQWNAGDTISIYETSWLDSTVPGPILVFSDVASVRNSILDSIGSGQLTSPKAHVYFGKKDKGHIRHIDAQAVSGLAVTCEFRAWKGVTRDVDFSTGYQVLAVADSTTMAAGVFSRDWPGKGLMFEAESSVAWVCKGGAANTDVAVTIEGSRGKQ